jgi:predicted MPP superfamily phosphohydrolase
VTALITRRSFLKGVLGASATPALAGSGYAFWIEPRWRLLVAEHVVATRRWNGAPLRMAVVADIHACEPWMPVSRIAEIVDATNALNPDLVLLPGDFVAGLRLFRSASVPVEAWAAELSKLEAPLGAFAVLGNHDWWTSPDAVRLALQDAGIVVLENEAVRVRRPGGVFWIAGLGDQMAVPLGGGRYRGVDDLPRTVAALGDNAPAILMAHEPDIFPRVPERFALTVCGHTHGGQVNVPLVGRPVVPSRFGERYAYGHIREANRDLVVSAGLGVSIVPVRFGVPPEITLVTLSGGAT